MFYLDCDTTPPLRSKYVAARTVEAAKQVALSGLDKVTEGQIGIYKNALGFGGFFGYAIKYAGQTPYFEVAEEESAA